ncbi:hypothetical protein PTKU46_85020 [Paraburkholderia terrae]
MGSCQQPYHKAQNQRPKSENNLHLCQKMEKPRVAWVLDSKSPDPRRSKCVEERKAENGGGGYFD